MDFVSPRVPLTLEPPPPAAWQPITFGGVAAFAAASMGRLFLVASLVACLVAGAVVRALYVTWLPALSTAINHLPAQAEISDGKLAWPATASVDLVDDSFLAILVRPQTAGQGGQTADVQFEFGATHLVVSSFLGVVSVPYPRNYVIALSRTELTPLWGAWRPHLVAALFFGTAAAFLLVWFLLGLLLAPFVRGYTLMLPCDLGIRGCWRLAVAALLPAALVLASAVTLYGMGRLSAGELLLFAGLHFLVALGYLLVAPLKVPHATAASVGVGVGEVSAAGNPFAAAPEEVPARPEPGTTSARPSTASSPEDARRDSGPPESE